MPTVQSATDTTPTTTTQNGQPTNVLGKDDFLKLLTMQLKNQDPLNPMDGTQFASQLAQFSSVEQLSNINTTLQQSIDANYLLSQSINNALAATFVGKDVRASGDTVHFDGTPTELGYTLPSAAETVTVTIRDASGAVVRTMTSAGREEGDNTLTWDGKDDDGVTLGAGQYTFSVSAKDSNGASLTATTFFKGRVSGVRFKSDGTVFVVDGTEVKLSSILEILED